MKHLNKILAATLLLAIILAGCTTIKTVTTAPDGSTVTNSTSAFDVTKAVNAINIGVPASVRLAVAKYPQAAPYLRDTVTAIRLFTSGSTYDPAALHAAIATTGIRELKDPDLQAAIDVFAGLYKGFYGDVVTQKLDQVKSLLPILNAIADSIEQALPPIAP